ncbi:mCpol domain-containing protein [Streptomyces sp. NPDC021224]|uniref:mCpol domain-containing protein n=1 Tax=unclassified Streptomyces TaxID=2593676 RepID=UPI00378E57A7
MPYLIIDGDDIGSKIEAHLLANDIDAFVTSSKEVSVAVDELAEALTKAPGIYVVSTGGDSILARVEESCVDSLGNLLSSLQRPGRFTFSAGIGDTLRETFIALRMAKATGKHRVVVYSHD